MAYDRALLVNPLGIPEIITAKVSTAIAFVSGGDLVVAGSVTTNLGSTIGTYNYGDFVVSRSSSSGNAIGPVGMAMNNNVSGGDVAILSRGIVILQAAGVIETGERVVSSQTGTSVGDVSTLGGQGVVASGTSNVHDLARVIGIALTPAADDGFVLVKLTL